MVAKNLKIWDNIRALKSMKLDLERINGRIKTQKLSTVQLAEDLGITRQSLYNKLNGKYEFKTNELEKLSTIFGNDIFIK